MVVETTCTTVDVVIPTIGRGSVVRAVRSANSQTISTRVFVVLDRLEELSSLELLLQGFECEILLTAGAQGGSIARNIGFGAGTSSHVAFLDDDDWWDPEFLASRLEALSSQEGSQGDLALGAFMHGYGTNLGEYAKAPGLVPPVDDQRRLPSYIVMRDRLKFGRNAVQTSSMLFRRDVLEDKPWDETLPKHQDWDLVLKLVSNLDVTVVWDDAALSYVERNSPLSVSKRRNWRASYGWWETNRRLLSKRASADFLVAHVLRAAVAQRDMTGVRQALRGLRAVPHLGAVAVGLSGISGK
ncbi:glycosyltransferase [Nesterenkonia sandarakina]|uniref:Glycosyltransferase involved in cell wall biosynthesis n=1 Tax=Nesterenkonia sandarakina TaxID=272918 RepID=A0A7Z0EAP7_9MICC|nr:glycosyltransferase involved in cell wall biosynthesis [Nesterenkonia sandarakina]